MATRHPKPTVEQNAGRLVRRAAQVLEDRAWVQNAIGDKEHGMCVRGAICFAATGTTATSKSYGFAKPYGFAFEAELKFSDWLVGAGALEGGQGFMGDRFSCVPQWNDTEGRTKEEVVQYMRKFADEVDPQLK